MLDNIESVFREQCKLVPDRPVLVGVSGGADSLCLLEALHQSGYQVIVGHFDHQLRPTSGDEARSLEKIVSGKNISFVSGSENVGEFAERESLSIEEAARRLRYGFLFEQAEKHQAQALAAGHIADDQVETVLMHFLRGAGLNGLRGMSYRSFLPSFHESIPLVRPLLGVWREETVGYCVANGLQPFHDPSNDSLDFRRNRIRHELIPYLEEYNPRFREAAWRMADTVGDDYSLLGEVLDAAWGECVRSERAGLITFEANLLSAYAPGTQRNLLRRGMKKMKPDLADLHFGTLDNAAEILSTRRRARIDLPGGLLLFLEGNQAFVTMDEDELPVSCWPQMPSGNDWLILPVPGQETLAGGWVISGERKRIQASEMDPMLKNEDPFHAWLDAEGLPEELQIRSRRPGDRFVPLGMDSQSMKLSDFYINEKMPLRAREAWPLLCSGDEVIWVPGYRPAHPFSLTEKTSEAVYFRVIQK